MCFIHNSGILREIHAKRFGYIRFFICTLIETRQTLNVCAYYFAHNANNSVVAALTEVLPLRLGRLSM